MGSPVTRGRIQDVVRLRRPLFRRPPKKSPAEITTALTIDIVRVLAEVGINLKNVHTIARKLVECGWEKRTESK